MSSSSLTIACALAAVLGALAVGAAVPALAEPIEPQQNSLQDAVDGFAGYLKSETYDAAAAAGKIARDNRETIDAAKAAFGSQLADLRGDTGARRRKEVRDMEQLGRARMERGRAPCAKHARSLWRVAAQPVTAGRKPRDTRLIA